MQSARLFFAAILLSGMAATVMGCGESGSEPAVVPEIRLDIADEAPMPALTPAEFTITQLVAGGVSYQSLAGRTLRAPLAIFLENAPGPCSATLSQTPSQLAGGTIGVSLLQLGGASVGPVSSSEQNPITIVLGGSTIPQTVAQPEIRIELCAPLPNTNSCSITDPLTSNSQIDVTGSVGDAFVTRLFGQASSTGDPRVQTPLIIFFQNPRFEIAGVFRSSTGVLLQAQLFIDGALQETAAASTSDVVVRSDL